MGFLYLLFKVTINGTLFYILLTLIGPMIKKWFNASWNYVMLILALVLFCVPVTSFIPIQLPSIVSSEDEGVVSDEQYDADDNATKVDLDQSQLQDSFNIKKQIPTGSVDDLTAADPVLPIETEVSNHLFQNNTMTFVTYVWILGIMIFLVFHIKTFIIFHRALKKSGSMPDESLYLILEQCKTKLKIKRKVFLQTSPLVSTPMLTGVFRPTITVPVLVCAKNQLDFIFQHELLHFKRKDLWIKLFALCVNSVHWFNPFIYLLRRSINQQCELALDEMLVKNIGKEERKLYGLTILELIEQSNMRQNLFGTAMSAGKKEIEKRMKHIIVFKKMKKAVVAISMVVCFCLTSVSVFAAEAILPMPPKDALYIPMLDHYGLLNLQSSLGADKSDPDELEFSGEELSKLSMNTNTTMQQDINDLKKFKNSTPNTWWASGGNAEKVSIVWRSFGKNKSAMIVGKIKKNMMKLDTNELLKIIQEANPNTVSKIKTIPLGKISQLEIQSDLCGIAIEPSSSGQFELDYIGVSNKDIFHVETSVNNTKLTVSVKGGSGTKFYYVNTSADSRTNTIRIKVPKLSTINIKDNDGNILISNVDANVSGSTKSGLIKVANPNLTTDNKLTCENGDIIISGTKVSGKLDLGTENGDVNVFSDLVSGSTNMYCTNGDIKMNARENSGNVAMSCTNGDVVYDVKTINGTTKLSCTNGDINASVDTINNKLTLETGNGDVYLNLKKKPINLTYNGPGSSKWKIVLPKGWKRGFKIGNGIPILNLVCGNGDVTIEIDS